MLYGGFDEKIKYVDILMQVSLHHYYVTVHHSYCFPLETQNVPYPEILPTMIDFTPSPSMALPSRTLDCSMFFFEFFHERFNLIRAVDYTGFLSVFDCTLNMCILTLIHAQHL